MGSLTFYTGISVVLSLIWWKSEKLQFTKSTTAGHQNILTPERLIELCVHSGKLTVHRRIVGQTCQWRRDGGRMLANARNPGIDLILFHPPRATFVTDDNDDV